MHLGQKMGWNVIYCSINVTGAMEIETLLRESVQKVAKEQLLLHLEQNELFRFNLESI